MWGDSARPGLEKDLDAVERSVASREASVARCVCGGTPQAGRMRFEKRTLGDRARGVGGAYESELSGDDVRLARCQGGILSVRRDCVAIDEGD
jgi:hypothetical protein